MGRLRRCSQILMVGALATASAQARRAEFVAPPPAEIKHPTKITHEELSRILLVNNWADALEKTKDSTEPLLQLINMRALYELKKFDDVLKAPKIVDPRFQPYDSFLRISSGFASKQPDEVLKIPLPIDLPRPLRERLWILRGDTYREKGDLETSIRIFKTFSNEFPNSTFQGEVLFRLAELALARKQPAEALKIYEKIYRSFPLNDSEDIARQKLLDAGVFTRIDTDTHLSRIEILQKSARFKRAENELDALKDKVNSPEEKAHIEFATAQLQFAQRNYSTAEKLSRSALDHLPKIKKRRELQIKWQEILAWSLTRQNKHEEGVEEYQMMLKEKDLPSSMREIVIYRLAMIAMDDLKFLEAAKFFEDLRKKFPTGRYRESAHWFGGLAILFAERSKPQEEQMDPKLLQQALKLLTATTQLPDAEVIIPQALYYKAYVARLLKDEATAKKADDKLASEWKYSFHELLKNPEPFKFIRSPEAQEVKGVAAPQDEDSGPAIQATDDKTAYSQELSWQRLEAFRSVGLQTWAKMELDRFINSTHQRGNAFFLAIAERLEAVEDWGDLFHWVDRFLKRDIHNLDLDDPVVRYHYPKAYAQAVADAAKEFSVPPYLLWGVMREESRFQMDVISHAGAVGLMQLMPSLADRIGSSLGEWGDKKKMLTDPVLNIRYGASHLRELMDRFAKIGEIGDDIRLALIIASYNAGIDPVMRWMREKDTSRVDFFVEAIPYAETRLYVKRVIQSAHIYFRLYGEAVSGPTPKDIARTKNKKNQIGAATSASAPDGGDNQ